MNEEDDLPDVYNSFKFKLRMVRFIGEHIIASRIDVVIDYALNPAADNEDIILAWNKIEIWLQSLNQAIAINAANPLSVGTTISGETHGPRFANLLMVLPGEPTEEILGYAIQAKLNALAGDTMAFGPLELEAEEADGITFALTGDFMDHLPTMEEWVGPRNWFTEPWWCRDDGSIIDSEPPEGADLTVIPEWTFPWDFLKPKPKQSGVVISGRFKPRLVEDVKKDEDKDTDG